MLIDQDPNTAVEDVSIASLVRAYDKPGPRYTSYPTAVEFNASFGEADYRGRLQAASLRTEEPLSLYVHLPFCEERCSYCGCAMIATKHRTVAKGYLPYLEREMALLSETLGDRRRVAQLHWGGGTPTYFNSHELRDLHAVIRRHFDVLPAAECAIEIDPRVTTGDQLLTLRELGFNRLSMGVQDLEAEVQAAIGRHQTENQTCGTYDFARHAAGFPSINIDLVYGLPRQGLASFTRTVETIVRMRPDRIAVYSYAHVPWMRPHQNRILQSDLPAPALKIELISAATETFLRAGYVAIGMDHFALPDDDLAIATRERRLHRNFMGYTTQRASDVLGIGMSAIGDVCGAFAQNVKKLTAYYRALDEGRLPIERGYALNPDDLVRRAVITELMCNFHVDFAAIGGRFGVEFTRYFATELEALSAAGGPVAAGLLSVDTNSMTVTPRGRLFVRTICMQFDKYLAAHAGHAVFSRTV
jgi:oxygen-independent coproporphyrinogen III oxidase